MSNPHVSEINTWQKCNFHQLHKIYHNIKNEPTPLAQMYLTVSHKVSKI